jgi:hypothetical protein
MSSAFYPLGMKSYNNHVNQGGYKSWKGTQTPVGLTSGTIRPLTNNDPTNDSNPGFGLPRPIKHARKGRGFDYTVLVADGNQYKEVLMNRINKSSTTGNLVSQLVDQPGGYSITQTTNPTKGIGLVSSYYPNDTYLTENPEPRSQTPAWCCNAEKKARRRVTYASTNIKKNYYTTLQQYRENRCLTFDQRAFNFVAPIGDGKAKPGDPQSTTNLYLANCQPNTDLLGSDKTCKVVVYKPNNYQFAKQGAVDSSTRLLKLNVDTITKGAFTQKNNMLKSKVPACNNPPVLRFQNKQACRSSQPVLPTDPITLATSNIAFGDTGPPDISMESYQGYWHGKLNFSFNEQDSELY